MTMSFLIKSELQRLHHVVFSSGAYDLNLIGLRSSSDASNLFDDVLVAMYLDEGGEWRVERFAFTSDPGRPWLEKPMREAGCAIIVPGQYRSVWTFGLHKGKYEALVQIGEFKVWRDNNRDGVIDRTGLVHTSVNGGINLHKAGANSQVVGEWSAGCQVLKRSADFDRVMELAHKQKDAGKGSKFTYTLIDVGDQPVLADLLSL